MRLFPLGLGALALVVGSCGQTTDGAFAGPDVTIQVAPLTLPGIQDVCYSLAVFNADATGQAFGEPAANLVWEKADLVNGALCSTRYGDGAGSLSFVGTCDASAGTGWIQLSLDTMIAGGGPLIEGQTVANGFINPCPDTAPCVLSAPCVENADTAVEFNLTVMRAANQGFFDIAVSFEDIFCSAKLDCGAIGEDRNFLYNDGARDMTVILAVSCTGGPNETEPTHLYMDDVHLTCTGAGYGALIDASSGPGNVTPVTNDGGILFGAAVYRGDESLAGAAYWNVALGLNELAFPDAGDCTITTRVTASAAAFTDNTSPAGTSYPVIDVDVLAISGGARVCTFNPLNGAGSGVTTEYTPIDTAGEAFDHGYVYGNAGLIEACPAELVYEGLLDVYGPDDLPADYECLTQITSSLRFHEAGNDFGTISFDRLQSVGALIFDDLSTGAVDVSFPALTSANNINISGSAISSMSFAALETHSSSITVMGTTDAVISFPILTSNGDGLQVNGNTNVDFQAPLLASVGVPLTFQSNSAVSTFSLPSLESCLALDISANADLTAIDLPNLTTVQYSVGIQNNPLLSTCAAQALVDGLSNSPSVTISGNLDDTPCLACPDDLVIDGNLILNGPASLPADYQCITEITGLLVVQGDGNAYGAVSFDRLHTVGNSIIIPNVTTSAIDVSFPALTSVGDYIDISGSAVAGASFGVLQTLPGKLQFQNTANATLAVPVLATSGGLELNSNTNIDLQVPALTTIGGTLAFQGNSGTSTFSLPLVESTGYVTIQVNTGLTALDWPQLTTVNGTFRVTNNAQLSTCAIQAIVAGLTPTPTTDISGNLDDTASCP